MADDRPKLEPRFSTWQEWDAWTNANCPPARSDDTPVLAGQTGPRRRATREELIAFVEGEKERQERERDLELGRD
jgi:hypothetical protein